MRLDWSLNDVSAALAAAWYSPRAPRVVELALALLIASQAWALWRSAQPEPAIASDTAVHAIAPVRFGAGELSQLLGAHLFGEAPQEAAATALAPTAFKLVGLYVPNGERGTAALEPIEEQAASDTREDGASEALAYARRFFGERTLDSALPGAMAWVSVSGAPGQRVQVGGQIGGGTVREITPEGVTLELDGRRVRVAFPENPFLAMFRGESDTVLVATDPNAIPAELASPALRFLPVLDGNTLAGFRVYPGSDEGAFAKTGLRAGDVIEAIDGRSVTVPRDVLPLLSALRETRPVAIRLRRGPAALELTLFKASGALASASRQVVLPPGYQPSPTTRPPGAPPPKPRAAPSPPPDLSSPPPSVRRSASP